MDKRDTRLNAYVASEPVIEQTRALHFRSNDPRAYARRAYVHFVNGDYYSAETDYYTAMGLNPVEKDIRKSLTQIGRLLDIPACHLPGTDGISEI
jgi:hypothetical protein